MKIRVFTMSQEKLNKQTYEDKLRNKAYVDWYNAHPLKSGQYETKEQINYYRIVN